MSLEGSLSIAASGLANINRHLAVVSQNVANVGTAGYARQVLPQSSIAAGGQGMGVRAGVATREIDLHLQQASLLQTGEQAALAVRQAALSRIDAVQGTPGMGTDLSSLLGLLGDSFTQLAADPASQPRQAGVVTAAADLARQISALDGTYAATRQAAHDAVVADVRTLNDTLAAIGDLSTRIVQLHAMGQSTADLENQRDAAKTTLSGLVDARYMAQQNGDLLVATGSGIALPTRFDTPPFSVDAASVAAAAFYPGGGIPAVMLRGVDVTTRLGSGALAGNIELRDTTLPTFQAELDEFARTLSARFEDQGLRLFTDPAGTVPPVGTPVQDAYVGYGGVIGVNPAVSADPALVRDGTHDVAASASGAAAFTANQPGGPAGFDVLARRVLDYALGSEIRPGVAQPLAARTGLGPGGALSAPYPSPADLAGLARALVGAQSQESADVTQGLDAARALGGALEDRLGETAAVSIDQEMTRMLQLQSAYAANARVIATVQAMMDQTLQMLR